VKSVWWHVIKPYKCFKNLQHRILQDFQTHQTFLIPDLNVTYYLSYHYVLIYVLLCKRRNTCSLTTGNMSQESTIICSGEMNIHLNSLHALRVSYIAHFCYELQYCEVYQSETTPYNNDLVCENNGSGKQRNSVTTTPPQQTSAEVCQPFENVV
jgi:hypothetical protein